MIIGVPKEIKNNENRVSMTPSGVHRLVSAGHKVIIEESAGLGSGIADAEYEAAGAAIEKDVSEVFSQSDIIVKVKEPLESEYHYFKEGQILYTYLHLAPNPALTNALLEKKVTGIAYETVETEDGALPLLLPMSEIAGRMSVQVAANYLQSFYGGEGVLLSGVPGVAPAEVVIVGGGSVGTNAAKIAVGMRAHVTVFDVSKKRLSYLDDIFGGKVTTVLSSEYEIAQAVKKADVLIGCVLVPGKKAPKVVTAEMVKTMKKGAVIVDVAIDQGGSIETIDKATTHDNPIYEKYGVIHYSVANMPGSMARTSTYALTGSTIGYLFQIAQKGAKAALLEDKALLRGLNTFDGHLTNKAVAESLNIEYTNAETVLK